MKMQSSSAESANRGEQAPARTELTRHVSGSLLPSNEVRILQPVETPYILAQVNWKDAKESNTGDRSAATNTGYRSAATVEGRHSVAIACGIEGRAKAGDTGAIVLTYRDPDHEWAIVHIFAAKVGERGIKADTWYSLNSDGEPVECDAEAA